MARVSLEGPDKEILTKEDVTSLLHVSDSTLERMIRDGRFPRGIKAGAGSSPLWTRADIAAWLHIAPRMNASSEEKKEDS